LRYPSHIATRSSVGLFLADGPCGIGVACPGPSLCCCWRLLALGGMIQIDQFFLLSSDASGMALLIGPVAICRALPKRVRRTNQLAEFANGRGYPRDFGLRQLLDTINQYLISVNRLLLLCWDSSGFVPGCVFYRLTASRTCFRNRVVGVAHYGIPTTRRNPPPPALISGQVL